jgi:hypothetical protein
MVEAKINVTNFKAFLAPRRKPGLREDQISISKYGISIPLAAANKLGQSVALLYSDPDKALAIQKSVSGDVLYGSSNGLSSANDLFWNKDSSELNDEPEPYDSLGSALAVGDFNNNGFDDLAIGVPWDFGDATASGEAGAVHVIYGSSSGLSSTNEQLWSQDSSGVNDATECCGEFFGDALAVGDFNNNGFDDLAIGVWGEDVADVESAGAVSVLYGSSGGLSSANDQFRSQANSGIEGDPQSEDRFGDALAVGDFNNNGFDDLAIGVTGEDIGSVSDAGAINVLYGSTNRLSSIGSQFWHHSPGIGGSTELYDGLGSALAGNPCRGGCPSFR